MLGWEESESWERDVEERFTVLKDKEFWAG